MRARGMLFIPYGPVLSRVLVLGTALALTIPFRTAVAQTPAKPTGAPLVLSNIETEQAIPLASLSPDGKTANCTNVRLHWISKPDVGPNEDAADFTLDLPTENPRRTDLPGAALERLASQRPRLAGTVAGRPLEDTRYASD